MRFVLGMTALWCSACVEHALPVPPGGVVPSMDLAAGPDLAFTADLAAGPSADLAAARDLAPPPPSLRSWVCPRDSFLTVSWASLAGAIGYQVYASTTSPVTLTPANAVPSASPGVDVPAVNGTPLYVVVQASLGSGGTVTAPQVSATPLAITVPHDELWASTGVTYISGAVEVWDGLSSLPRSAQATRTLNGTSTGLLEPNVGSLAVDPLRGSVYVSDTQSRRIGIWDFTAASLSGDVPPTRTLISNGPTANLQYANFPSGVALDVKRQILYHAEESQISVFLDACGADQTAPDAEVAGADTMLIAGDTHQLHLDEDHDDLYVATYAALLVFHPASALAAGGDIAPARVIHVPGSTPFISAVWRDASTDELYIGDQGGHCIHVVSAGSAADGLVQPSFVISNSAKPIYPTVLSGGGGYLFDDEANQVRMWTLASLHAGQYDDLGDLTKTVVGSLEGLEYVP